MNGQCRPVGLVQRGYKGIRSDTTPLFNVRDFIAAAITGARAELAQIFSANNFAIEEKGGTKEKEIDPPRSRASLKTGTAG